MFNLIIFALHRKSINPYTGRILVTKMDGMVHHIPKYTKKYNENHQSGWVFVNGIDECFQMVWINVWVNAMAKVGNVRMRLKQTQHRLYHCLYFSLNMKYTQYTLLGHGIESLLHLPLDRTKRTDQSSLETRCSRRQVSSLLRDQWSSQDWQCHSYFLLDLRSRNVRLWRILPEKTPTLTWQKFDEIVPYKSWKLTIGTGSTFCSRSFDLTFSEILRRNGNANLLKVSGPRYPAFDSKTCSNWMAKKKLMWQEKWMLKAGVCKPGHQPEPGQPNSRQSLL